MGHHRRSVHTAAAVALFSASFASAQPHPDTGEPLVRASVHAEHTGIAPGQTVWIGVRFEVADGWHTYWPGQNDTGFGTVVNPSGPASVTFGPIQWPAPRRYVSPGNILDHVYEKSVLILVPATLATDATPGDQIELNFALDWLVCKELCIPGDDTVRLTLPVTAEPGEPNTSLAAEFAAARARLPHENSEPERIVTVDWQGEHAIVRARGAHHMAFYPDSRSSRVADLLSSGVAESDTLRLQMRGESPTLSGYVEVTLHDQRSRIFRVKSDPRNPN